jgi:hypothetical protein
MWGRDHLEDLGVAWRIKFKWIFKSKMGVWNGLVRFRIGTGGWLF